MTEAQMDGQKSDHVQIQKLLESASGEAVADRYTGKRRWTRFTGGLPCELATDPTSPTAQWFVTLHNVSGGGFSCWSKTKVASRARIFVREFSADQPGVWIPARVCHCTAGIRGYLIGASFESQIACTDTSNGPGASPRAVPPVRPAAYPPSARTVLSGNRS